VSEFAVFFTVLRKADGSLVAIPNTTMLKHNIHNFARGKQAIKVTDFTDLPLGADGQKTGVRVREELVTLGIKDPRVTLQKNDSLSRLTVSASVFSATDAGKTAKIINAVLRKHGAKTPPVKPIAPKTA
jgi:hypothetical protein